jgi:hypothetical protein
MHELPVGATGGQLSLLFLEKLCERLETVNVLPPGTARAIWNEISVDLAPKPHLKSYDDCRKALVDLMLIG